MSITDSYSAEGRKEVGSHGGIILSSCFAHLCLSSLKGPNDMAGQVGCVLQGELAGVTHETLPDLVSPVEYGLPTAICFIRPSERLLGSVFHLHRLPSAPLLRE